MCQNAVWINCINTKNKFHSNTTNSDQIKIVVSKNLKKNERKKEEKLIFTQDFLLKLNLIQQSYIKHIKKKRELICFFRLLKVLRFWIKSVIDYLLLCILVFWSQKS